MTAFDDALGVLVNDANLAIAITYTPAGSSPIACRGIFARPDIEPILGRNLRLVDVKRSLMIRAVDVPSPARGDTVTIGSETYRVLDISARDPQRLAWSLQLGVN